MRLEDVPLPFTWPQGLFEHGEIIIVEMFFCLAAMLPYCLFFKGASHFGRTDILSLFVHLALALNQ
jgi:hypothetical protein